VSSFIDSWRMAPGDRVAHFYTKSKTGSKVYAHTLCRKMAAIKVLELCSTYERECRACKARLYHGDAR
jgi:hypothetical protein